MVVFILNQGIIDKIMSNIKFHNNAIKKHLRDKNISHFLFKYDLMEYNFKDISSSFNISYFTRSTNLEDNLVNVNELKKYESMDEFDNNKIVILIKKFKLRVSVFKVNNFSKEVVICDAFDFDFKKLSHYNSLIKIAIINDNLQDWLNNENISNYDIIFTTEKEYIDSLKKIKNNVYKIKKEDSYSQLKNILNLLFKRKSQELHYFIPKRFKNVFPKYKNYFNVLESEYFDEEWYKKEYGISENTDSVIHYLLVGFKKNYNPGPNFIVSEYYECNKDIESKGVNPLLHYEKFGRKENRIIHISQMPERDYSTILNSSFFDSEWYRRNYDIAEDVDCADHYLKIGFLKGYNPCPEFNTFEYLISNPDIKESNMNPLLHYELYGRKEKRKLLFSDEEHKEHYQYILNSPFFDSEWYRRNYDIAEDVDCADHYLKIGYAKRYNPSPDFNTSEYYECNKDVEEYGMNPLLHYEKFGRDEKRIIHLSESKN